MTFTTTHSATPIPSLPPSPPAFLQGQCRPPSPLTLKIQQHKHGTNRFFGCFFLRTFLASDSLRLKRIKYYVYRVITSSRLFGCYFASKLHRASHHITLFILRHIVQGQKHSQRKKIEATYKTCHTSPSLPHFPHNSYITLRHKVKEPPPTQITSNYLFVIFSCVTFLACGGDVFLYPRSILPLYTFYCN